MSYTCGSCDGSGKCQNDHHNSLDSLAEPIGALLGMDNPCPSCGKEASSPGKCSVCGGSGERDG